MTKKAPLQYVGGKTKLAPDIVEVFPDHRTYVEVFGGSAAVLFEKSPSTVEIYNDLHDDVVNYFSILRDSPEDLQSYLRDMPYSRSLFEDLKVRWYDNGDKPSDAVERAAEYFFLQTVGINALHRKTGFGSGRTHNHAREFQNIVGELNSFAERFRGVIIENLDWRDIVDKYDSERTLFYFDPPYLEAERGYYAVGENFDHEEFVETIHGLEGRWACSYGEVPQFFGENVWVTSLDADWTCSGKPGRELEESNENLITNYDPDKWRTPDVRSAAEGDW